MYLGTSYDTHLYRWNRDTISKVVYDLEKRHVTVKEVQTNELKTVYGGSISIGAGLAIVAGIVFIIGAIDGYLRPLSCHKS